MDENKSLETSETINPSLTNVKPEVTPSVVPPVDNEVQNNIEIQPVSSQIIEPEVVQTNIVQPEVPTFEQPSNVGVIAQEPVQPVQSADLTALNMETQAVEPAIEVPNAEQPANVGVIAQEPVQPVITQQAIPVEQSQTDIAGINQPVQPAIPNTEIASNQNIGITPVTNVTPETPKKKKKLIFLIIPLILLIVVGAVLSYLFLIPKSPKKIFDSTLDSIFAKAGKYEDSLADSMQYDLSTDTVKYTGNAKVNLKIEDEDYEDYLDNLKNIEFDYGVILNIVDKELSFNASTSQDSKEIVSAKGYLDDTTLYVDSNLFEHPYKTEVEELDWDEIKEYSNTDITNYETVTDKFQTYLKTAVKDEYLTQTKGNYTVNGKAISGYKTTLTLSEKVINEIEISLYNNILSDNEMLTALAKIQKTKVDDLKDKIQDALDDCKAKNPSDDIIKVINIYTKASGKLLGFEICDADKETTAADLLDLNSIGAKKVTVYVFSKDGCSHCQEAEEFFEDLEKDSTYGEYFQLKMIEVYDEYWETNETMYNLMEAVADEFDDDASGVPYIVIGNNFSTVGYSSYEEDDIKEAIKKAYNSKNYVDLVAKTASNIKASSNYKFNLYSAIEDNIAYIKTNIDDEDYNFTYNLSTNELKMNLGDDYDNLSLTIKLGDKEYSFKLSNDDFELSLLLTTSVKKSQVSNNVNFNFDYTDVISGQIVYTDSLTKAEKIDTFDVSKATTSMTDDEMEEVLSKLKENSEDTYIGDIYDMIESIMSYYMDDYDYDDYDYDDYVYDDYDWDEDDYSWDDDDWSIEDSESDTY